MEYLYCTKPGYFGPVIAKVVYKLGNQTNCAITALIPKPNPAPNDIPKLLRPSNELTQLNPP